MCCYESFFFHFTNHWYTLKAHIINLPRLQRLLDLVKSLLVKDDAVKRFCWQTVNSARLLRVLKRKLPKSDWQAELTPSLQWIHGLIAIILFCYPLIFTLNTRWYWSLFFGMARVVVELFWLRPSLRKMLFDCYIELMFCKPLNGSN